MKDGAPSISVVIAAYDEETTIAGVVRGAAAAVPEDSEVVVIDDGSRDRTAANASEAGARVVSLPENRGKGIALRRGIREARGEILLFIDGDGQDDPAEIPSLLEKFDEGADFVNGSRFAGVFHPGSITPLNRMGNRFMTSTINLLFRTRITDSQAGFRAIRKECAESMSLEAVSYEIETEMLLQAITSGMKVVEVPVNRCRRGGGATHFNRIRNGLGILFTILKQRLTSSAPARR